MHVALKITTARCRRTRLKIKRSEAARALTRKGLSRLICDTDKHGFEGHARHLFNGSRA